MLVISQKTDHNTKISQIEKKVTDQHHDKYITSSEFNNLTAKSFAAVLSLNKKITRTKKRIYWLKINLKNHKHLIRVISEIKVILKKMALKSI